METSPEIKIWSQANHPKCQKQKKWNITFSLERWSPVSKIRMPVRDHFPTLGGGPMGSAPPNVANFLRIHSAGAPNTHVQVEMGMQSLKIQ